MIGKKIQTLSCSSQVKTNVYDYFFGASEDPKTASKFEGPYSSKITIRKAYKEKAIILGVKSDLKVSQMLLLSNLTR